MNLDFLDLDEFLKNFESGHCGKDVSHYQKSMADPGFPSRDANLKGPHSKGVSANLLFEKNSPKTA